MCDYSDFYPLTRTCFFNGRKYTLLLRASSAQAYRNVTTAVGESPDFWLLPLMLLPAQHIRTQHQDQ